MFAVIYVMVAMGYFPAISITANLHMDFLPPDEKSRGRGRSFFGSLNYVTSAFGALAIPLIHHEMVVTWFGISIGAILVAAVVLHFIKDDLAVKAHPWKAPDKNQLPFFPQIINVDKLQIPWQLTLVKISSLAAKMWPVFFVDEWVAVAMIFCSTLANVSCGLLQVRISEWVDKKDRLAKKHFNEVVSLYTLILLAIAVILISTGAALLCIIGAILIGIAMRIFIYLDIHLAQQTGRGTYTYFFVGSIGQSFACMMGMISLTSIVFLVPLPFILIGIYSYIKTMRKANQK